MASKSLGTLTLDLIARIGGFEQGMDKAARKAKSTSAVVTKAAANMGAALGALGVAAVASTAALVKQSIDFNDAVSKQSRTLGIAVEDLSALNYAAELSDVSFEQLTGGLTKFNRAIRDAVEGSGAGADAFASLGVNVKNADGSLKSTKQLLDEVADAFQRVPDGALKSATAQDLFGKSGTKLIPLLNDGAKGLADMRGEAERFGQVLDTETAARAEEFNDNLTRLQKVISGTGNDLAAELLPSLVEFTDLIQDPETQAGIKSIVKGIADVGIAATKAVTGVANFAKYLGESLAASVNGPALDDLVRLSDRLDTLNKARPMGRVQRFAMITDLPISTMSDAEIDAEIQRVKKALDDGYAAMRPPKLPAPDVAPAIEQISVLTEAQKAAAKESERLAKQARDAELARLDGIEQLIAGMERERATLGFTSGELQLYELYSRGATQADMERARAALAVVDAYEQQAELIKSINDDIQADFEDLMRVEKERLGDLLGINDDTADKVTEAWNNALEGMQDSLADFLFDPFEDGLDGMLKSFGKMLQRMIAEAAAAQIMDSIFGAVGKDGKRSGGVDWANLAIQFAGMFDSGGKIPAGGWGIVGEKGPEIVRGPANITGRKETARTLSGGGGVSVGQMVFPGVTNAQEARRATGEAARQLGRLVTGSARFG